MVKVKLFASLRDAANGQRVVALHLDAPVSANDLLRRLVEDYGERARALLFTPDGAAGSSVVVMRNGETLHDREQKVITSGDEVAVLLPVAGG